MAERYRVSWQGRVLAEAETTTDGTVVVAGQRFQVAPTRDGRYVVTDARGVSIVVAAAGPPPGVWVSAGGYATQLAVDLAQQRRSSAVRSAGDMSAPMPATVVTILVAVGDQVTAGTPLLMLEAMKMELPVRASRDGVVRSIACAVGQLVTPGRPLVELSA